MAAAPRLGDLLLSAGLLDEEQLSRALAVQRQREGTRLGEVLLELGYVTEERMIYLLARQLKMPVVQLDRLAIPADAIAAVPLEVCRKHGVIPISRERMTGDVRFASSDPADPLVQADLVERLKVKVHMVLCGPTSIARAIEQHYGALSPDEPYDSGSSAEFRALIELSSADARQNPEARPVQVSPLAPPTPLPPLTPVQAPVNRDEATLSMLSTLNARLERLEAVSRAQTAELKALGALLLRKNVFSGAELQEERTRQRS